MFCHGSIHSLVGHSKLTHPAAPKHYYLTVAISPLSCNTQAVQSSSLESLGGKLLLSKPSDFKAMQIVCGGVGAVVTENLQSYYKKNHL